MTLDFENGREQISNPKSEISNWTCHAPAALRRPGAGTRTTLVQSMSRTGNCWDNAAMESFFKTLKIERVHRTRYETRAQAKLDIVNWIEDFYNRQRIHSSIGYKTPVGVESLRMTA